MQKHDAREQTPPKPNASPKPGFHPAHQSIKPLIHRVEGAIRVVNVVVDPLGQDGSGIVDLLRRARIPGVDALGQVGIRGVHALDQGEGDLVTVVVDSNQPLLYAVGHVVDAVVGSLHLCPPAPHPWPRSQRARLGSCFPCPTSLAPPAVLSRLHHHLITPVEPAVLGIMIGPGN